MKKSLLAVLLAVALVAPVFATEKGDMEIVGKLGLNLTPNVAASGDVSKKGYFRPWTFKDTDEDTNMSVLIGAEFFYYLNKNVALGFGINNNFNAELKDLTVGDMKFESEIGFTNFYFAVKPKIEMQSEIFNSIYFVGQLGYGILRFDSDYEGDKLSEADGNGLYWGIGAGTEIYKNFIVELLYSVNYGSIKAVSYMNGKADLTYTTLTLNVGYKFAI
ncbi:outer membrane beta-barrel protein [Candidatus Ruminimicrobiellum ovillum]|uniref:outer membrane beta-barrel protein n=1 Tax=Candidatus Ruminimicrobiellum ovillum TaxID=1947927 RepID=UPI00355AC224